MSEASAIALSQPTDQLVAQTTTPSKLAEIMREARSWFQHKPSVELAQIIGCDVRTAERYFAGDRTPATEQVMAMLRSEIGVKLIEAAIAGLPKAERDLFWSEMALATLRHVARQRPETTR